MLKQMLESAYKAFILLALQQPCEVDEAKKVGA